MVFPFSRSAARTDANDAAPEHKSQPLVALELSRQATFTAPHFGALVREGYARNPVVYRCVRLIAESCASVPITGAGLPDGVTLGGPLESFFGYLQVSGAAYLEAITIGDEVREIRSLRPDAVTPLCDRAGEVCGYEVETTQGKRTVRRDPITGRCAIMALRLFNPGDPLAGQSPLRAAATSVDLHNQGTRWAKSLLDNSARPSGALIYSGQSGERLTRDQVERLKAELETGFSGPARAGRPMVLEGGLDWKSMSLSPSDMDFTQGRREAARDIALAFGVPPMLLGIPGDNTYSNYAQPNQAFWRQTVMPLVTKTANAVSAWLSPWTEEPVLLAPDFDRVPALAEERAALWARLESASFLSTDEKRALAGLPPADSAEPERAA